MQVVILTTRQNFAWTSMQEILPAIEALWYEASSNMGHEVIYLDVDQGSPKENTRLLLKADLVVVTAFNVDIANTLLFLRKGIGNICPWYFYLHGLATISLWPAFLFGLKEQFYKHDYFIGTCEGDRLCLMEIFEEFSFSKIPFYLIPYTEQKIEISLADINIHYVGRLSSQKNIEKLIEGFSLFLKENPNSRLHLYGSEDHLGHPNMGIISNDYKEKLEQQILEHNIGQHIIFHGHKNREEIQYLLNHLETSKNVFVSASTHSDENFGMAIFRALASGQNCLISDWGGHKNFKKYYPHQCSVISCTIENDRPSIDSKEIALALIDYFKHPNQKRDNPAYFTDQNCYSLVENLLKNTRESNERLHVKSDVENLLARKKNESDQPQKIFEGYHDPFAKKFLDAYRKD
jgi:glycosyltransferase involved in cell wall biosynthesis